MKIAFVQFLYMEYLGIMYLSAGLKQQGHTVEIFICPSSTKKINAFVEEIVRFQPDIAGFSIMTGSESAAVSLIQLVKERIDVYSIFGGPHPSIVPEIIEQAGVDCVCIGESDQSLVSIVGCLAAGRIPDRVPGAWFKINGAIIKNEVGPLVHDLEALPRPDRSLYQDRYPALRGKRAGFITGRGCSYHCTFCANHAFMKLYQGKGAYVRKRSVEDVIAEIHEVVVAHGTTTINFEDDIFIEDRTWALKFCDMYRREIRLPFSCHIRADLATDELMVALANANCKAVSFGIETGDVYTRHRLLKKSVTDDQISECAALLRKNGIRFRTLNILGLPDENLEKAFRTVDLNVRIKADYPWCSLYQPLPGTELWEHSIRQGFLKRETTLTQPSFFKDTLLQLENKNEIMNLHKLFIYAVKFPILRGIIRKAIRIRPNMAFDLLFACAHAWVFFRSSMVPLSDLLAIGFMNFTRYLPHAPQSRRIDQDPAQR